MRESVYNINNNWVRPLRSSSIHHPISTITTNKEKKIKYFYIKMQINKICIFFMLKTSSSSRNKKKNKNRKKKEKKFDWQQ